MALTMAQVRSLMEGEGLRYFVDPTRDALMLGARGFNGYYQLVVLLELDGIFLQFRSINYHSCPIGSEHVDATLKLLGELNYSLRFVKFGWDPSDGEVTVFGDTWIEDGTVTQKQFGRIAHGFLALMDLNYARIDSTIRTGEDPGPGPAEAVLEPSGLPREMQALLDQLRRGLTGGKGDDDEEEGEGIDSI